MLNDFNWESGEFEQSFIPYESFFNSVAAVQKYANSEMDERKAELKRVINGNLELAQGGALPYLETNAQEGGGELAYAENLPSICGHQAAWFNGSESGREYFKTISCRKHYCPKCGGAGGEIHKSRMHSLFNRINPDSYNIRQFVFTIPESLRDKFKSRENLNLLFRMSKQVIEKHFGNPVLDKNGYIKKYVLDKPAAAYLHVFGDLEIGVFKPHVNVHIFESKKEILVLSKEKLEAIKFDWLKKLKKFEKSLTVADIYYNFATKKGKLIHKLKYMSKPWSLNNYEKIESESLKRLLVLELSGFQYLRYWGQLSNRTYKDEMDLTEIQNECENLIEEKLYYKGISLINIESYRMANRIVELNNGFYMVLKKGEIYVPSEWKKDTC